MLISINNAINNSALYRARKLSLIDIGDQSHVPELGEPRGLGFWMHMHRHSKLWHRTGFHQHSTAVQAQNMPQLSANLLARNRHGAKLDFARTTSGSSNTGIYWFPSESVIDACNYRDEGADNDCC